MSVGTNIGLGPLGTYGGPTLGATVLPGGPSPRQDPRRLHWSLQRCHGRGAGFVRPFPTGGNCDIGAFEASILTFGGPFGFAASSCSAAITFFSGGTAFTLRTGSAPNTLMSYLSIKGSAGTITAGTITAGTLVPRAGVPSTFSCTVPDPAAPLACPTGIAH